MIYRCYYCIIRARLRSDCKKAAEINKRENVDWKAMAEKKAQMDKDFSDMMNDMGGLGGQAQAELFGHSRHLSSFQAFSTDFKWTLHIFIQICFNDVFIYTYLY